MAFSSIIKFMRFFSPFPLPFTPKKIKEKSFLQVRPKFSSEAMMLMMMVKRRKERKNRELLWQTTQNTYFYLSKLLGLERKCKMSNWYRSYNKEAKLLPHFLHLCCVYSCLYLVL